MKQSSRLLGWVALMIIFASSLYMSVEGQKLGQSPWAAMRQRYGRRLSNRNRANDRVNQRSSVRALPRSRSSTSSGGSREGKNLRNTFPFNSAASAGHSNAAGNGRRASQGIASSSVLQSGLAPPALDNRGSRQRGNNGDEVALDIGSIAAAGERCIDKVVMVQETEYDDVITCKHSYSEKCHTTYATDFTPQQEEKCEENFKKSCFIEYKKQAADEPVQFCFTPLVKNCDIPGPTECSTEYTSECVTRYEEHDVADDVAECVDEVEEKCEDVTQGYTTSEQCTKWPIRKCNVQSGNAKKYSPQTECKKVPFELCGPGSCPVEPGAEECQERTQTVVVEVPEETCNLEPQKICKHVTKLVPHLVARENCIDIPKEVCSRSRTNPRKVDKPIVKKWCYNSVTPIKKPPTKRPSTTRRPGNNNQGGGRTTSRGNGGGSRTKPPRTRRPRPTPKATTFKPSCNPDYDADHCVRIRNDGTCNPECNTKKCGWDGRDCKPKPPGGGSYLPPKKGYE